MLRGEGPSSRDYRASRGSGSHQADWNQNPKEKANGVQNYVIAQHASILHAPTDLPSQGPAFWGPPPSTTICPCRYPLGCVHNKWCMECSSSGGGTRSVGLQATSVKIRLRFTALKAVALGVRANGIGTLQSYLGRLQSCASRKRPPGERIRA